MKVILYLCTKIDVFFVIVAESLLSRIQGNLDSQSNLNLTTEITQEIEVSSNSIFVF